MAFFMRWKEGRHVTTYVLVQLSCILYFLMFLVNRSQRPSNGLSTLYTVCVDMGVINVKQHFPFSNNGSQFS